jgi:adenylate cyclase
VCVGSHDCVVTCPACGTQQRADAKFCDECGASVSKAASTAEYKQVTVLFADVVHSMDIAATVGPERLRELMSEVFDRCCEVVQRYGGTVDKFTGDGVMAVFGAPMALEDHAIRACVAALDIQKDVGGLAVDVRRLDGIDLALRIGLNSGEVIAGEVGSRARSYTTIGDQVGMAQRMESVGEPGGVMLSESTARLVGGEAVLGARQLVQIKGADNPVAAYSLRSVTGRHFDMSASVSTYVGREWELAALKAILKRSVAGHGSVVGVVGPPGIGKSRTVAEAVAHAEALGMRVFSTYCESHTSDVAFQAAIRLLRSGFGVDGLADEQARARVRSQTPGADPADVILLQDELGIRDPADELPDIAPDARRRRLSALVNATVLARDEPAVFVIEDAHWVDPTSEALLSEFLAIVPRTRSVAIVTFRPEYTGPLSRSTGAQTIALAPLDDSHIGSLIAELLGPHSSVAGLASRIADRASGNPFFAEEIVRDLVDRGVLQGKRGGYRCEDDATDVDVPPTVQAAIAARIDRLAPEAKQTLNAASVIGLRFDEQLLRSLDDVVVLEPLITAELVDQVAFAPRAEYAFRHPLILSVAYRSQLAATRAGLHRRLAHAIEACDPESSSESAALIAEHLETAGDLADAFGWHMRAGEWLTFRDIAAGRLSWERACQVADRVPTDQPGRDAMRIAPRALLCATAFRAGGVFDEKLYEELCLLASAADDKISLALALSGRVVTYAFAGRYREALGLASELVALVEGVGDPMLELTLLPGPTTAILMGGDFAEALRLADRFIELADGDASKGGSVIESPLALGLMYRLVARMCLGQADWRDELPHATGMVRDFIPLGRAVVMFWMYGLAVAVGAIRPGTAAVLETADILASAEERGDDLSVGAARFLYGYVLAQQPEPDRSRGVRLLVAARETTIEPRSVAMALLLVEIEVAEDQARRGNLDAAMTALRSALDRELAAGEVLICGRAAEALVEVLLLRGGPADIDDAQNVIEQYSSVPEEQGAITHELPLLRMRALVARACGEESYRQLVEQYRARAMELGYEGHIAKAEAMA